MGTRADFYVGKGKDAEWLGSTAWDGFPEDFKEIVAATTEADYRAAVQAEFSSRDDATLPADGWPWPWEDSGTTDFAYAFADGAVWVSNFGTAWMTAREYIDAPSYQDDPEGNEAFAEAMEARPKIEDFPNMKDKQNVTFGKRSGVMILGL